MAKRSSKAETGILRKKNSEDTLEELLVFGYACTIFRDDEKALYIDQGKHLIPWMGDEALKIDRYDGRGALSELAPYEANRMHYDSSKCQYERQMEARLDEERYWSLNHNEEELEMYEEEELKKLRHISNQVQYSYDVPDDPENQRACEMPEDERPFIPPVELTLPQDIEVPKTYKENARIEKTASFVSQQGAQMEILIKTKQADNPQFSFLTNSDPLHPYYKHLLAAIKSGQYTIATSSPSNKDEEKADESCNKEREEPQQQDSHYLHPSLQAASFQLAPPPLPTVNYKPSPNCSYYQLVNRIQGVRVEPCVPPPPPPAAICPSPSELASDHQQYYYTPHYEYYKQAMQYRSDSPDDIRHSNGQLPHSRDDYAHYIHLQHSIANPYAQIVSNVCKDLPQSTKMFDKEISETSPSYVPPPTWPTTLDVKVPESQPDSLKVVQESKENSLFPLVQYGSDSENEEESLSFTKEEPPSELKQIIDKMASYVFKNGKDFEQIVKERADARFDFLKEGHKYHPYYMSKLMTNKNNVAATEEKPKSASIDQVQEEQQQITTNKPKEKKMIAPVSFSIKKAKDEGPKEIKSALPVEESDEENENVTVVSPLVLPNLQTPQVVKSQRTNSSMSNAECEETKLLEGSTSPLLLPPSLSIEDSKSALIFAENKVSEDSILDLIDLTDDNGDERQSAERRSSSSNTALQLERKKKAAAFLKLKSKESSSRSTCDKRCSDSREIVLKVEDSESAEEGEIKRHKRSHKKKKSSSSRKRKRRSRSRKREPSSRSHSSKESRKSSKKHKKERVDYSSDSAGTSH